MLIITRVVNGKISEGTLEDHKKEGHLWIDCVDPTKHELEQLSHITGILTQDLSELLEKFARPEYFDSEEYSQVVYAAPNLADKRQRLVPVSFFVIGSTTITLKPKKIAAVDRLRALAESIKLKILENPTMLIYKILDEISNDFFRVSGEIEDDAELVEERVLKNPDKSVLNKLFSIKKTLIFYHKALIANREVITAIEKGYLSHLDKRQAHRFREVYNDVVQLIDMEETFRDIITSTVDIYLTSVSNNLNEIMRKLTVYGSFILVPTLITGIYGMNFRFMPEISWLGGYPFAIGLMVVSILFLYIYFKNKNYI